MTTKELIKILKKYPSNAEVLLMKDWNNCPVEEGRLVSDGECLVDLTEEEHINDQIVYIDQGLDWDEVTQVIIG